jgi:hypothetical protein
VILEIACHIEIGKGGKVRGYAGQQVFRQMYTLNEKQSLNRDGAKILSHVP